MKEHVNKYMKCSASVRANCNTDADAPEESEVNVFLLSLPEFDAPEGFLSGYQIQQEQHSPVGQVVF